jgi:hypothetical protein
LFDLKSSRSPPSLFLGIKRGGANSSPSLANGFLKPGLFDLGPLPLLALDLKSDFERSFDDFDEYGLFDLFLLNGMNCKDKAFLLFNPT